MSTDYEFVNPEDRPALVGVALPLWHQAALTALTELNYKIHFAASQAEFLSRLSQVRYPLALLEEGFAAPNPAENVCLQKIQAQPMNQRRTTVFFLLGDHFQTLNPLQAFQYSVQAVVNQTEAGRLKALIERVMADHEEFVRVFLATQRETVLGER